MLKFWNWLKSQLEPRAGGPIVTKARPKAYINARVWRAATGKWEDLGRLKANVTVQR